MMMNRSPQEEAEENAILEAAKAIESARRAEELTQRANAPAGANSPTAGEYLPLKYAKKDRMTKWILSLQLLWHQK